MKGRRVRVRHRSRKVRSDSRTIPLWGAKDRGDGEDHDRYWKCWHCGFTCDVQRDELGDSESRTQINMKADALVDDVGDSTGYCFGAAGTNQTLCEANGGTWTTSRFEPEVTTGCRFCGSKNWRGDYF